MADSVPVDGKAFREHDAGGRLQFRFIVSPEDGAEYDDPKPLVRRLMAQTEKDLGTKFDWDASMVTRLDRNYGHSPGLVRQTPVGR